MDFTLIPLIRETTERFQTFKSNPEERDQIIKILNDLKKLVLSISEMNQQQLSGDVISALDRLERVMREARALANNFDDASKMKKFRKSPEYKTRFETLDRDLNHAFMALSGALHAHIVKQNTLREEREQRRDERERRRWAEMEERRQSGCVLQ